MALFENVRADLSRIKAIEPNSPVPLRFLIGSCTIHALLTYRLGRALHAWPLVLRCTLALPLWCLYGVLAVYVRQGCGIRLSIDASIGAGFYIGHFGGVDIRRCSIGRGCTIGQQTMIGPLEKAGATPTIADGVWIGVHSQIVGGVNIGSGATIGAGTRVTQDVAPGSLVMGRPPRVIVNSYRNTALM